MEEKDVKNGTADENSKPLNSNPQQRLGSKRTSSSTVSNKSFAKRLRDSIANISRVSPVQLPSAPSNTDDDSGTESSESDENGEKIEFMIVPLTGNPILIKMYPDNTLFDLQDELHSKLNILPEMQQICISGSERPIPSDDEDATLGSFGIKAGSLLRLSPKMNSGLDNVLIVEHFSDIELPGKLQFQSTDFMMQKLDIQCNADPVIAPEPSKIILSSGICQECKKRCRPGLQFKCRCGGIFCNLHRYNDLHRCSFDFRSHDRAILQQRLT